MKFKILIFSIALSAFCTVIANQKKYEPALEQSRSINSQDMPSLLIDNPLKDLSTFTFVFMLPAAPQEVMKKMKVWVETELKRYGKVSNLNLFTKEKAGEGINLHQLDTDGTLIYDVRNIVDINGKELPIARASLNLKSAITINKTKQEATSYIWSNNCFSQLDLQKDLLKIIQDSVGYQIKEFMTDYSSSNANKPTFSIYIP